MTPQLIYNHSIEDSDIHNLCEDLVQYSDIAPKYYERFDVKRGLRNADGSGVIAGITRICMVHGYVMSEGIKFSNVKAYYDVAGATSCNSVYNVEDYVYDATNVRMREISLGYTFRNLFGQSKNLTLAFIARNLFFFYKDAPMDPDVSMGTGNGLQGFDVFNLPTTRSFGLNVKLNF